MKRATNLIMEAPFAALTVSLAAYIALETGYRTLIRPYVRKAL